MWAYLTQIPKHTHTAGGDKETHAQTWIQTDTCTNTCTNTDTHTYVYTSECVRIKNLNPSRHKQTHPQTQTETDSDTYINTYTQTQTHMQTSQDLDQTSLKNLGQLAKHAKSRKTYVFVSSCRLVTPGRMSDRLMKWVQAHPALSGSDLRATHVKSLKRGHNTKHQE